MSSWWRSRLESWRQPHRDCSQISPIRSTPSCRPAAPRFSQRFAGEASGHIAAGGWPRLRAFPASRSCTTWARGGARLEGRRRRHHVEPDDRRVCENGIGRRARRGAIGSERRLRRNGRTRSSRFIRPSLDRQLGRLAEIKERDVAAFNKALEDQHVPAVPTRLRRR
jgi:hypothetical protein